MEQGSLNTPFPVVQLLSHLPDSALLFAGLVSFFLGHDLPALRAYSVSCSLLGCVYVCVGGVHLLRKTSKESAVVPRREIDNK